MAKLDAILNLLADIGATGVRKVFPTPEETVLSNIRNVSNDIVSGGMSGGFSMNPRTGQIMTPKQDMGLMMATRPEIAGLNRQPVSMAALESFINEPTNLQMMRRGGYLGGWVDGDTGELVLDVPTRFMNRSRAVARGADADQKAYFDLLNEAEIPLTPENIYEARRQQAALQALRRLSMLGSGVGAMSLIPEED